MTRLAIAGATLMLWTSAPGCGASHRYDSAPPLSFSELEYPGEVEVVELEGVKVAYVDAGPETSDALVLVHGLGENIGFWEMNLLSLARHRRVVAVDLPGYGRSDKPEMAFTMAWYADVLDGLMAHLDIQRAVLVGHSMGGQVVLTTALQHPERVAGLILAAPAGIETFDAGEAVFLKGAVSTDLYMGQTEDQIRSNYRNNLFFEWKPTWESLVKQRVQLGRSPEFKAYAWAVVQGIHAMLDGPVFDRLGQIQVPVLVMFGFQDALIPNPLLHGGEARGVGEAAVAALPRAELVMIDAAGHMLQYEQPDRFNAEVLRWLEARGL